MTNVCARVKSRRGSVYGSQMENDFYCENVLSGKLEVSIVFESEHVLAYEHTRPFWETHIVVVPKRHISSFLTLNFSDSAFLAELMDVIKHVAESVVKKTGAARILTNLGVYQESKHLHFHIYSGMRIRPDNPI